MNAERHSTSVANQSRYRPVGKNNMLPGKTWSHSLSTIGSIGSSSMDSNVQGSYSCSQGNSENV